MIPMHIIILFFLRSVHRSHAPSLCTISRASAQRRCAVRFCEPSNRKRRRRRAASHVFHNVTIMTWLSYARCAVAAVGTTCLFYYVIIVIFIVFRNIRAPTATTVFSRSWASCLEPRARLFCFLVVSGRISVHTTTVCYGLL